MGQQNIPVLIIDLENKRIAQSRDMELSSFTERHHVVLPDKLDYTPVDDVLKRARRSPDSNVILLLHAGLPRRNEQAAAAALMRQGKKVFVYWPAEGAIEVVDSHRLKSFNLHALVSSSYFATRRMGSAFRAVLLLPSRFWTGAKSKLTKVVRTREVQTAAADLVASKAEITVFNTPATAAKRLREAGRQILGADRMENKRVPSAASPLQGTGAYVRLDYWAKLTTGGSYGHTCFLARALAKVTDRFECVFANRYELLDVLKVKQNVLPHNYPSASSADFIHYGRAFEQPVAAELDRIKPLYVYERSVLGNRAAAIWCHENNVPYIVEFNGSELAMARTFGRPYDLELELELYEDYGLSVATLINVISEPVAEELVKRGFPREKILVNPNCVDPDFYKPASDEERKTRREKYGLAADDLVVGFCGTFGGWHGIEVLAEAIPRICAANPTAKFLLIGDGNLKHLVQDAVAKNGLQDRVVDLGLIPQIEGAQALTICDILLAPHAQNIDGKTFFGSPTKLFEYLAVGAAVVASDLAQLGEIMRPSLTAAETRSGAPVTSERGVLVAPGSVEDLVDAVGALASNPEMRIALARNAHEAVLGNYTWDIHIENIWKKMADMPLTGYSNDRVVDTASTKVR